MGLNTVVIMSLFMLLLSGWLCHSSKLTPGLKGRAHNLGGLSARPPTNPKSTSRALLGCCSLLALRGLVVFGGPVHLVPAGRGQFPMGRPVHSVLARPAQEESPSAGRYRVYIPARRGIFLLGRLVQHCTCLPRRNPPRRPDTRLCRSSAGQ
jgi:hypothetical protein